MATRLVKTALSVLALMAVAGAAGRADAAGFQLFEQSPSGQGDAFAGAAAAAEDASTIFYNPAGLTYLKGPEAIAGVHIVWPEATFQPHTATTINGPLTGKRTPDGGEVAEIPNLYGSLPLDYGITAGIGVSEPFGLVTDYGGTWIGRYHAERSDLSTVVVNPSLAWKATDWLSVGGGIDIMRTDVELTNAIDFGSICTVSPADGLCGPVFHLSPQANDGQVKLRAHDTTTGYNGGVMLQPLEHTRIGLTYRSSYVVNFNGTAEFSVPTAFRAFQAATGTSAAFTTTGARAKVTLPETASGAVYQELTPKWAVLGDVTWTRWSRFKNLTVQFDNPFQPEQTTHEGWHNTFREAGGVLYSPNEKSKLRFGIAYDPTPVRTANRTFRIPDDNRFWTSIGYNLHVWEGLSFDAAYTHIFVLNNAEVNATSTNPANPQGTVSGTYSAQVNIFAVGLRYQF